MTLGQQVGIAWRLLRPFTLTASIIPVLIGTGIAVTEKQFHSGMFIAFIVACVLIQGATNMFNEYFDFKRGLDSKAMVGIAGTIVHHGVRPRTILYTGFVFILASLGLGIYICAFTSWWIAIVGIASLCVGYFYSRGPRPLAYTPFGEVAAAVAMGPVIVLLGYFIQARHISTSAVLISLPIGLLIGAILLGNNIRDMDHDKVGGRRTIAIRIGRQRGIALFVSVFVVTYALILGFVLSGLLPVWTLLVLFTVPSAVYVSKLFLRYTEPAILHPAVKGTTKLLFQFGVLMFAGIVVSVWVPVQL